MEKRFTEISGISSHRTPQANQKLQFLQDSYLTASLCISTNPLTIPHEESFRLKGKYFKISISIRLSGRPNKNQSLIIIIIITTIRNDEGEKAEEKKEKRKERDLRLSKIAAHNPAANSQRRHTRQSCRPPYLHPP